MATRRRGGLLLGFVDHAHAAATQDPQDPVALDLVGNDLFYGQALWIGGRGIVQEVGDRVLGGSGVVVVAQELTDLGKKWFVVATGLPQVGVTGASLQVVGTEKDLLGTSQRLSFTGRDVVGHGRLPSMRSISARSSARASASSRLIVARDTFWRSAICWPVMPAR